MTGMLISEISTRLETALFHPEGTRRASIAVPNDGGSFEPLRFLQLLQLLGLDMDASVIAGWCDAAAVEGLLGSPLGRVSLRAASDAEWRMWSTSVRACLIALAMLRQSPNILTTETAEWVLFTGPSDFQSHLYPLA